MTKEQAREAAAVMLGWADGKEVQYRSPDRDVWIDLHVEDTLPWDWTRFIYRLKPTPTLRPWTADEVPLGAWLKWKKSPDRRSLVCSTGDDESRLMMFNDYEHSTDGGLNWKPCGVEEVGK